MPRAGFSIWMPGSPRRRRTWSSPDEDRAGQHRKLRGLAEQQRAKDGRWFARSTSIRRQARRDATYEIPLRAPQRQEAAAEVWNGHQQQTQDGVRFSVLVNGNELWSETKATYLSRSDEKESAQASILPGQDPFSDWQPRTCRNTPRQTIKLTLRINALKKQTLTTGELGGARIVEEPLESR